MSLIVNDVTKRYILIALLFAALCYYTVAAFYWHLIETTVLLLYMSICFIVSQTYFSDGPFRNFVLSMVFAPIFQFLTDIYEQPLMAVTRLIMGPVNDPEFIVVLYLALLPFLFIGHIIYKRPRIYHVIILIFMAANSFALYLFHQVQVDRFVADSEHRIMLHAESLINNYFYENNDKIIEICEVIGYRCLYGDKDSIDKAKTFNNDEYVSQSIDDLFNQKNDQFRHAMIINENDRGELSLRFISHQILIFYSNGKALYIDDKDYIFKEYESALQSFSILYTIFLSVWMSLTTFVLFKHKRIFNKKLLPDRKKPQG